jgi:succinyl-CoA synthetase beta subunit
MQGGVRSFKMSTKLRISVTRFLNIVLNQHPIQFILVEKAFTFSKEYYFAVISDLDAGCPVLRLSEAGGATYLEPESFKNARCVEQPVDINVGLKDFQIRRLITQLGIDPSLWKQLQLIAHRTYDVYRQYDATLVEINSLVVTQQNQLFALDYQDQRRWSIALSSGAFV